MSMETSKESTHSMETFSGEKESGQNIENNNETITKEEFQQKYAEFLDRKKAVLEKLNGVRGELGLNDAEEMPFDITEEENKLRALAEKNDIDFAEAESNTVEERNVGEENKEIVTSPESTEEKPLEVGDEIYKDGTTYRIIDFRSDESGLEQEITGRQHLGRFEEGGIDSFMTPQEAMARKKKELKDEGIHLNNRTVIAAITEGGFGGGTGGLHEFNEGEVTKLTPERKEKIAQMKKETGREEGLNP